MAPSDFIYTPIVPKRTSQQRKGAQALSEVRQRYAFLANACQPNPHLQGLIGDLVLETWGETQPAQQSSKLSFMLIDAAIEKG